MIFCVDKKQWNQLLYSFVHEYDISKLSVSPTLSALRSYNLLIILRNQEFMIRREEEHEVPMH